MTTDRDNLLQNIEEQRVLGIFKEISDYCEASPEPYVQDLGVAVATTNTTEILKAMMNVSAIKDGDSKVISEALTFVSGKLNELGSAAPLH